MIKNKRKEKNVQDVNQHILNIITPSGIDFDKTHANIGENEGKIYTVSKFPQEVDYGWLAHLCNLEGTITQLEYRYTESANMVKVFNNKISELKGDRDVVKDESEKQKIDKAIADLKKMINRVSVQDEPIGYVNIILHIQANTLKELTNRIKKVSGIVSVTGCNLMNLKNKQFQALQCISPYGIPNEVVSNMGSRNMPISTFIGGFPMASSGINDTGGYYLGKTKNGNIVILCMWIRNKDRVNSNWIITGVPGIGKSTFIKDILTMEYAFGTKIITLDPEEEYVDLTIHKNIEGEVIDCASGKTGRINPLQIRPVPRVTKEDLDEGEKLDDFIIYDEEDSTSDMALHIQNLRIFFKLYFGTEDFTSGIKTKLEKSLIELYEKSNITWETDVSKLKNEDFPIMEQLYDLVEEKLKNSSLTAYDKEIYAKLSDLLFSAGKGADRFIWNGPTTLNPNTGFIDLNCSKLLDLDENVKKAQFMNLMSWGWQQIARDRNEKIIFAVDEGHLFIDPDNPDLMKFLKNVSKRARKYEGGLMFITHSVADILDPEVKRLGQAIIDTACYKFIMGCDGKNLEETKELFNLTEKEVNILGAKNRGQGILFAGSVRMEVTIDVRDSFLEMFGKAGGR